MMAYMFTLYLHTFMDMTYFIDLVCYLYAKYFRITWTVSSVSNSTSW